MIAILLHIAFALLVSAHILLRRHRQPETRAAWLLIVVTLPYLGALAYLLLGQTSIGRWRIRTMQRTFADLPRPEAAALPEGQLSKAARAMLRVGQSISGYAPTGGNAMQLMAGSDAAITGMVAVMRAAARGVACRVMVDDIGSRQFTKTKLWRQMAEAGAQTRIALPVGNPLLRMLNGRIDLRNHRKVLVIDDSVTYCGSQNCADPAFLPKARFGPWVDVVMRLTGPVVRQNQHLFACDWMGNGGDDVTGILRRSQPAPGAGFVAQVVATGPTYRDAAMPEMFTSLIFAARSSLFITTPYYVPTQAVQAAICSAAYRGVEVTILFPARNDDLAVGAASRSHYEGLLDAGVRVFEFQPGLLHAKTLTMDGEMALIGSANMDRRSFDLNYENNILLADAAATTALRARQEEFLGQSRQISAAEVAAWGPVRRLVNNALAIMGPVL
jgi:cardiolipin synthase